MGQILPKDDAFAYGSPNYGNNVLNYIGCKPTTGSSPFTWGNAKMHSAYQAAIGTSVFTNAGITTSDSESEANQLRPRGMMWRVPYAQSSTVTAVIQMLPLSGSPTDAHLAPRGVMGRIQGGTIADSTGEQVRYENVSCYLATVHRDGSGNIIFAIRKCSSGTFSTLTSQTLAPASVALLPIVNPLTVRMTLEGGSGATTITASFSGWGSIADITLEMGDASAIAGAGRFGFFMGRDRADSANGINVADVCTGFRIREGAADYKVIDEFDRFQLGSYRAVADQFSNNGFSLQGCFGWDHFQPSLVRRLKRHTTLEAAQYFFQSGDADNEGRVMLSARPATNSLSQHRSASLLFSAQPTAGNVWFGIAVRASQPTQTVGPGPATIDFPSFTGYTAFIIAQSASANVRFDVRRWNAGVNNVLADFNDVSSTYWPGYGSAVVLDLEVHNSLGEAGGNVILTLKADGVQVPLVKTSALSTVTVDGSGTITDADAGRITSGFGEGFVAVNINNENSTSVAIDDWTENTLVNVELPDEDQPTVITLDEGAAVGSLNDVLGARGQHIEEVENYGRTYPMESGHVQAVAGFTDANYAPVQRRRFLVAAMLTADELEDFEDFWNDHDGATIPFSWQREFDTEAWKVHFFGDGYDKAYVRPGVWRVSFALETLTSYSIATLVAARPTTFSDELGHGI